MVKHHLSFQIRSWADLPLICEASGWKAFHFRDCQNCFCPQLTLTTSTFLISLIPGTFHPRQWSLSSPCCPASEHFALNSNPLNPALTGQTDVRLHQSVLPSPLSIGFVSKGLSN